MRKFLALFIALLLTACGGTPNSVVTALQAEIVSAGQPPAGVSVSVDDVFDWAEKKYSKYFPSHQTTYTVPSYATYRYRYYPETGIFLVFRDGKIGVWDYATTNGFAEIASVKDFTCLVDPKLCAVTKPTVPTVPAVTSAQIKISTDITKNAYPTAYTTVQSLPVIDDKCALGVADVQYPASYMGNLPLPAMSGLSLKNVPLAVALKDNGNDPYSVLDPTLNKGCTNTNRAGFAQTLTRLKALGASQVAIPQYACIRDVANPDLDWATTGTVSIPDADLVWMGQQARAAGIKPQFIMQLCDHDHSGRMLSASATTNAWFTRFFAGYSKFMLQQAQLMQGAGYDAISLDWTDWSLPSWAPYSGVRETGLLALSTSLRSVFTGRQFLIATGDSYSATPVLLNAVDFVQIFMIPGPVPTAADELIMTVDMLKQRYSAFIPFVIRNINNKKPVQWNIMVYSVTNPYTNNHSITDYGCPGGNAPCASRTATPDFGRQAIGVEAALRAVHAQTSAVTDSVMITTYWLADNLAPRDSYPNLSTSIRNKPAEAIVYQWFKKEALNTTH